MKLKAMAFTAGGVVAADAEAATTTFLGAVGAEEGTVFVLSTTSDAAPIVERIRNLMDLTGICGAVAGGDLPQSVRQAFASVLGALAGMVSLGKGPAAALANQAGMREAYERARSQVLVHRRSRDWPALFVYFEELMPGGDQ